MNTLLLAKLILSFIDVSTELSKGTISEMKHNPHTIIIIKQAQQAEHVPMQAIGGNNILVKGFKASITKLNEGTLIAEHMKNF